MATVLVSSSGGASEALEAHRMTMRASSTAAPPTRWIVVADREPESPIPATWILPWQVPDMLPRHATAQLARHVMDRWRLAVVDGPGLETRPDVLSAWLLVLDPHEAPVRSVQNLARRTGLNPRALARGWADSGLGVSLGAFVRAVLLLQALALSLAESEASWNEVAARMGLSRRTLRRYGKRFLGIGLTRSNPEATPDLPRRVVGLGQSLLDGSGPGRRTPNHGGPS